MQLAECRESSEFEQIPLDSAERARPGIPGLRSVIETWLLVTLEFVEGYFCADTFLVQWVPCKNSSYESVRQVSIGKIKEAFSLKICFGVPTMSHEEPDRN